MSHNIQELLSKIESLEKELSARDQELLRWRSEVMKANSSLEKIMLQMSQELGLAQALQKFLTPTELPNITGFDFSTKFLPGTRSGGDYFDIFEHEDRLKFGILISSASGYSLSSVLLGVIIRISSQIEARRGMAPHKVLKSLAEDVVPQIKNSDSASVFYGVVDRRSFELEYSSVGSIDAFVQVYGQESLVSLSSGAPALGKGFETEPNSQRIQLNPRDRLILATEGLKEAQNSQSKAWGQEALKQAIRSAPKLGVHELRNEILFCNEKYSGKKDPARDQTLVIAEVKDRVIKLARS